jgi:hypothetical protein
MEEGRAGPGEGGKGEETAREEGSEGGGERGSEGARERGSEGESRLTYFHVGNSAWTPYGLRSPGPADSIQHTSLAAAHCRGRILRGPGGSNLENQYVTVTGEWKSWEVNGSTPLFSNLKLNYTENKEQ